MAVATSAAQRAQGLIQGRRGWQIVAVALYGRQWMRKALRPGPELVATARLEPGAAVKIETMDPRPSGAGCGAAPAGRRCS